LLSEMKELLSSGCLVWGCMIVSFLRDDSSAGLPEAHAFERA
jgi:hypothetical protein